jgi:hypothetical protein
MITRIYLDDVYDDDAKDSEVVGITDGCGCCSSNIYDREDLIHELKKNYQFLVNSCELLGITFDDLISD